METNAKIEKKEKTNSKKKKLVIVESPAGAKTSREHAVKKL